MVKMGNFFPQNKIFDQGRPANACLETVLVIGNFNPLIGGECLLGRITAICVELLTFFYWYFVCLNRLYQSRGYWP